MSKHSIFGTDGIRGIAGKHPLTVDHIRSIGFAAGVLFRKKGKKSSNPTVIVGMDTRASCPWIEKALAEGLVAGGCEVLSCGVIPTSAIAAILQKKSYAAGVVISASHNPPEFNGIKFFSSNGKKIADTWEREIERNLKPLKRLPSSAEMRGKSRPYFKAQSLYEQFLRECLPPDFSLKGLKWVIDCANGAASSVAPGFLKDLGAQVTVLHAKPDGKNINLKCGALHPEALQKEIVRRKAHGGCAFDGDADRVQFVDETGALLDGDVLIGMAAEHLQEMKELEKNKVVATVMANLGFFKRMKQLGIGVVTTQVGDRAVSDALESCGAVLGGEQSGHIIFKKYLPTGDGLLTALKILELIVHHKKKISHYKKLIPKTPQILLNVRVNEKVPIDELPSFKKAIAAAEKDLKDEGRILIRYSGTEPLLRIMVEGSPMPRIQKIAQTLAGQAKDLLQ